jgi:undecaprenyl phosphate N,N'-diacetylbacillosamine 1-phosphate transferase
MIIYSKYFKRIFDIFFSLFILILFLPIIIVICIVQVIIYNGKIFYLQYRTGLEEVSFQIIKFKTMKDIYGPSKKLLPDSHRLTKFGKFLRFFSLDELPNFFNVLLGQMSIVGPRPLPVKYASKMSKHQKKRFSVRPGITGLAQVSGRNNLDWNEKIKLDIIYINRIKLIFDFKIILRSLFVLTGSNENREISGISIDNYEPNFKKSS